MKYFVTIIFLFFHFFSFGQNWSMIGQNSNGFNSGYKGWGLKIDNYQNLYAVSILDSSNKSNISKWNGSIWTKLGFGTIALNANGSINPITIDSQNNVYVAGGFTDSIASNRGSKYVAKWNGSTWSKLGGVNYLKANGTIWALINDNAGNIYAAGDFTNGANNILGKTYVAKWDGTTWSQLGTGANVLQSYIPFGSNQNNAYIRTIIMDKKGNIYAAGSFSNSPISNKRYVAKWDGTTWNEVGIGVNGLNANNSIQCLSSDNFGNVYAAGWFTNSIGKQYVAKWDGTTWSQIGMGSNILPTNGVIWSLAVDKINHVYAIVSSIRGGQYADSHVSKWDGIKWIKLGNPHIDLNANGRGLCLEAITVDSFNNVFVEGGYVDSMVGGKMHPFFFDSIIYVAKWTACWKYDTLQQAICANANYNFNGKILTQAGYYNDTIGAYNGCDSVTTLHLSILPNPTKAITVAVCSSIGYTLYNGKTIYSAGIYNDTIPSTANGCDTIVNLTATTLYKQKTIYAAICSNSTYQLPNGTFTNQAGIYTDTVSYTNSCDTIITTHLSLLPISTKVIYDTGCINTAYVFYGTHLINAGVYNHVLKNYLGCDSTISLHLAFSAFNLTIAMNGNHLQATAANSYQWLNCPTMQPIAGATQAIFTATNNGSYALAANINGCIDTSNCIAVQVTGMEELTNNERLMVYPNPCGEKLSVSCNQLSGNTKVEVVDLLGRELEDLKMSRLGNEIQVDVSRLVSGIYFLKITDEKRMVRIGKFVKE